MLATAGVVGKPDANRSVAPRSSRRDSHTVPAVSNRSLEPAGDQPIEALNELNVIHVGILPV